MKFNEPSIGIFDVTAFDNSYEFEKAYLALCTSRRERADSYRKESDKKRSVAASFLLQKALSELGVSDSAIKYGEHGKPYLSGRDDVFFSLSHSGSFAVCAIYDKAVGIDIEQISKVSEDIIQKVATDSEYAFLMSLKENERYEQFTRLWTAKESYVKRDGKGFLIPPTELSTELSEVLSISHDGKRENVSFKEIPLSGYKLTVCY